jgi:hypothetical protein
MNNNIILLEKLYENMNNAYIKKERALSDWECDNEFLDFINYTYTNGSNMELFNFYIKEKMNYDLLKSIYNVKYKSIIKYIMKDLPLECINHLTGFI